MSNKPRVAKESNKFKHCRKKGPGRRHYQGPGKVARNKEFNRCVDGTLK